MQVKKVEKVNIKTVKYQDKQGKAREFDNYSFVSNGSWFTLKGEGKENVKQGDEVWGEIELKKYTTKDGKEGTEAIFNLFDKTTIDILKRLQSHEERLKKLEGRVPNNEVPEAIKQHNPVNEFGNNPNDLLF